MYVVELYPYTLQSHPRTSRCGVTWPMLGIGNVSLNGGSNCGFSVISLEYSHFFFASRALRLAREVLICSGVTPFYPERLKYGIFL